MIKEIFWIIVIVLVVGLLGMYICLGLYCVITIIKDERTKRIEREKRREAIDNFRIEKDV